MPAAGACPNALPRPDAVLAELRRWWGWMKNYRVWEARAGWGSAMRDKAGGMP